VDLSGKELVGVDLSKANLTKANLSGIRLSKVDLYKANLTDANLTNADLSGPIQYDSHDESDERVDLTEATLRGADFTNNLSNTNLTGATLSNANLTNANLTKTNLTNVYLKNVNLTNTILDLSKYGLPQNAFRKNILNTLTNPLYLKFLLCLRGKGLFYLGPGINRLREGIENSVESGNFTPILPGSSGEYTSKVFFNKRFTNHIGRFIEPKSSPIDLPFLYEKNYERITEENLEEVCDEVVRKEYKIIDEKCVGSQRIGSQRVRVR